MNPYIGSEGQRKLNREELVSRIPGWGADLDPSKRPAVPKEKRPPNGTGAHWKEPERMIPKVRIHKSTEHQHLTPVFGTTCPPRLLSGLLRDFAYRYSEGRSIHWLTLLFADRVDVLESAVIDLFKGKPDRPIRESGLRAEITRHGLRSRIGQHRTDVGRIGKEALLAASAATAVWSAFKYWGRRESPRSRAEPRAA